MDNFITWLGTNWLYIVLAAWGIIALANKNRRDETKEKLTDVITKSAIPRSNQEDGQPLYSKQDLENIAGSVYTAIIDQLQAWIGIQKTSLQSEWETIYDPQKPSKPFGYFVQLVLFIFFFWGDAIAIANALQAEGLLEQVPGWLTPYEITVAFGSLFTAVVGALVANDIYGKGEFSDWGEQPEGFWKVTARVTTALLLISGIVVITALGLARYRAVVNLPSGWDNSLQVIAKVTTLIIVPVNAALCAILIHREALKGVQVVYLVVRQFFLMIPRVCLYIAKIFGAMGIIGLDLLIRLILVIYFIVAFLAITPLDAITSLLTLPFRKKEG